jgi:hypothetical protein
MPLIIPGNSSSAAGFTIDQSIRFNDDENPYMGRTPSATGTEETWTWSFWVKRATLGTLQVLFQIGADKNNCDQFYFNTDDQLQYQHLDSGSNTDDLETTQVFRDASAWYHIILVADTTNAVESERIRIYVNGERVTNFATENYPTQNTPTDVNTQVLHQIGAQLSATYYSFDGYMAEIHLLDGLAYDPSFFGEFNSSGLWVPKEYTGSYGTNGFKIDGRDASDLGDDESGNGNDFTTSGLASHDQMADSPTNNYAVMNPLDTHTTPDWTLSNGNLDVSWNGTNYINQLFSTLSMPSTGKWYFEFKYVSDSNQVLYYQQLRLGIMREDINAAYIQGNPGVQQTLSGGPEFLVIPGTSNLSSFQGDGANITNFFSSFSMGDVLNFARDGTKLWVGKNGTYYNSGDPANGTNATSSALELKGYRANMHFSQTSSSHGTAVVHAFFGADKSIGSGTGFNNTVPTGFQALNTTNLGS